MPSSVGETEPIANVRAPHEAATDECEDRSGRIHVGVRGPALAVVRHDRGQRVQHRRAYLRLSLAHDLGRVDDEAGRAVRVQVVAAGDHEEIRDSLGKPQR